MVVDITSSRPRATGKLLKDMAGQMVTVLGTVGNFESNNRGFYMTTSDSENINVKLDESLISELTPGIVIEVTGRVDQSGRIVLAESWIPLGSPIDFNLYNLAVEKMHLLGPAIYPHIDASQINQE